MRSLQSSTLLLSLGVLATLAADASAAPATTNPGATPTRPGVGPAVLGVAAGNIAGKLTLSSPIADPTWKGNCGDLSVVARSTLANAITVKATGNVVQGSSYQHCAFAILAPVGMWSIDYEIGGKSLLLHPPTPQEVKKGETLLIDTPIAWPTEPIGTVSGTYDAGQNPDCAHIKVKIVHPLRTFEVWMSQKPAGRCGLYSSNVPHGAVTVSVVGQPVTAQTGTISASAPVFTPNLVWPQFADVGVRLRPANYPQNQQYPCSPYTIVWKNAGVVVTSAKAGPNQASMLTECTFGSGPSVPADVPITIEVLKNGAVVSTQSAGPFPAKQHAEIVFQPFAL